MIRAMERARSTQVLADHRVLSAAFDLGSLPKRYLGTAFAMGRLFEELHMGDDEMIPAGPAPTASIET